ncbi:hypothetical protein STANM309S_04837 [Streptomyces tanashiensis]
MPGPIEPSTQRWRPSLAPNSSATSRAIRAPASESSKIRSAISYSPAAEWLEPNVLVSTQSTPTSKYASCTERTMSGRVTFRISLHPSRFWKSSRVGSWAWSMVPMAPSATTTRLASASRRAAARVRLSAEGVGNEAMDELPGMRRLSALHPRGRVHGAGVTAWGPGWTRRPTGRTAS